MNIPAKIVAHVRCESGGDPSSVVLQLTVRSGHRNPYQILLPKTDSAGLAELGHPEFVGQFKDHWESGLMDHNGTPESALPVVDLQLFDRSRFIASRELLLAWPLLKNERSRWRSREEWFDYYATCRNDGSRVLEFRLTSRRLLSSCSSSAPLSDSTLQPALPRERAG